MTSSDEFLFTVNGWLLIKQTHTFWQPWSPISQSSVCNPNSTDWVNKLTVNVFGAQAMRKWKQIERTSAPQRTPHNRFCGKDKFCTCTADECKWSWWETEQYSKYVSHFCLRAWMCPMRTVSWKREDIQVYERMVSQGGFHKWAEGIDWLPFRTFVTRGSCCEGGMNNVEKCYSQKKTAPDLSQEAMVPLFWGFQATQVTMSLWPLRMEWVLPVLVSQIKTCPSEEPAAT